MPILRRKDGGEKSVSNPAEAAALVASGEWKYANPEDAKSVVTTDPVTEITQRTPVEDYNLDINAGQQHNVPIGPGVVAGKSANAYTEDQYSGIAQNVKGAAEGAGSVLSFGGTDALGRLVGTDVAGRAEHTAGRKVGEVAGIAATMAAPFAGAAAIATPATALSAAAAGAKTAAGRVGLATAEGALFGAGNVLSQVALSDPGLTAESLAAAAGDFAHGAILGSALGLTGGVIGEGVGALAARRAAHAPSVKTDFTTGAGKEAATRIGVVHGTIDGIADDVATATAKAADDLDVVLKQNVADLHAGRNSVLSAGVDEVEQAVTKAAARFSDETATELAALRQAAEAGDTKAAIAAYNDLAPMVKLPRVSSRAAREPQVVVDAIDSLLDAQYATVDSKLTKLYTKAVKSGKDKDMAKYLEHTAEWASKNDLPEVADLAAQRLAQHGESAKHIDDFVAKAKEQLTPQSPVTLRNAAREALGLREGEKLTPNALRRFSETPDLVDRLQVVGKYYDEVGKAAAAHPTLKLQYDDAAKQLSEAVGNVLTPEAQKALTPEAMAAMLGLGVGPEIVDKIVDLPEPVHRLLQLAALYKGLGGVAGMRVKGSSMLRRISRSLARRGFIALGASGGYQMARNAGLGSMGSALSAAIGGTGGAELSKLAARKLGAVKVAAEQVNTVKAQTSDMVINGLGKGKPAPKSLRFLPGVHKVLDKLIGDPQAAKGKTEQEKFKLVQARLAQFAASPQSALDGVYHAIQPVQEASPEVADVMESTLGYQYEYAYETMPKDPGTMVSFGKSMWNPTDRELYEWGYHLAGSLFPMQVIGAIVSGAVPPQAVECLAKTNPAIFNNFVRNVMENADAIRENATYDQKIALGLALQMPIEPTTDPQYVAFIQASHAETMMSAAAGPTKETSSAEDDYSDAQKLLS